MSDLHDKRFPGESAAYRQARDELLRGERELRQQLSELAARRRELPLGGKLKEDYVFEEGGEDLSDQETVIQTRFSELFDEGKDDLIIYSFMYGAKQENPCPACTSLLDGLNGSAGHIRDKVNFVVVARAPVRTIRSWGQQRGWDNLRLLSSSANTYNTDYFAETGEGQQMPAFNVFTRNAEGIFHFYNTELLYLAPGEEQHPRHADLVWPVWNMFDMTPGGREGGWFPKYSYD